MPDLLVNLLKLPNIEPHLSQLRENGVVIRRAQPFEITQVQRFVSKHFSQSWADEIMPGFHNKPVSVIIAIRSGNIVGFAAHECTRKGFFGPTGVDEQERGNGIGKALLLACLGGLRELGYVYGIIGGAGPVDFYANAVGAIEIPDSVPGIYTDRLQPLEPET